eukprot:CAMPEP_0205803916 /NCGR_PEP_ID=MMETSP0205-20121125/6670_1 /ASSEMBLY_ACC=CAM_ASM_000278 /TAXON_ID=36767 /ORGANISM="Euplotes focardii, Strain TN1" /LENGTH=148 /DNA_ID=CAMNT_0053072673 /DNA_START=713 /DNA_END=1159 /DNA_ORIENTATION=-
MGVFKNRKKNNRYSYGAIEQKLDVLKEFNNKRKAELKSMYKKLDDWQDPDLESEDDLYEEELKTGSRVDIESSSHDNNWYPATVTHNLGNILGVVKEDGEDMEVDGRIKKVNREWVLKDSLRIAPHQSKSRSARARMMAVYSNAYSTL